MDEDNAMLLSCYQETIPAGLRGVAIEGGMNWATPHPAAIEESLVKLYGSYNSAETQQKVARAAQRIRSFDRQRAARVIYERIERALALSPAAEPLPETLVAG
jgi:hypothetical protein